MAQNVNSIVFRKDEYENEYDYNEAITDTIKILLKAGYVITVKVDDKEYGITCIDFDFADTNYDGRYPVWLTPNEREELYAKRASYNALKEQTVETE